MPGDTITSYRAQSTLPGVSGDGTAGNPRLNARLELVNAPIPIQFVQDGRVFHISNAAKQTALATGGTSFSDTAPAFIIDAPTGTTLVPLAVTLNQGGTVAGGVITVIIAADNKLRYSSGGTNVTPRNMRSDDPVASTVVSSFSTSPTAAAVGREETIYAAILVQGVTNTASSILPTNVNWNWQMNGAPPFLVGPASLVIYTFAAVTQPSWFFNIVWAEIPSVSVK